jgi:thioredoxin-like negative regulator of GroEL
LDTIGHLIRNGHRDDAIKLCEELKQSGEVDIMTLEMTLEFLGVKQQRTRNQTPLHEAAQLRARGKFTEAEQLLKSLLVKNPSDVDAALMLVRLYAQNLRQPGNAHEVLRALEQQPHPPASHIEFARRSIGEWSRSQPEIEAVAEPKAESVDELLEQKLFGSAIELLENKIKAQPQDFDLWLKLAEIHAVHCENFQTAEKIIRQIEVGPDFSREQIERARSKLKEWRGAPFAA